MCDCREDKQVVTHHQAKLYISASVLLKVQLTISDKSQKDFQIILLLQLCSQCSSQQINAGICRCFMCTYKQSKSIITFDFM